MWIDCDEKMGLIFCIVVIEELEFFFDQMKEIGMEFCFDFFGGVKFIIQCGGVQQYYKDVGFVYKKIVVFRRVICLFNLKYCKKKKNFMF